MPMASLRTCQQSGELIIDHLPKLRPLVKITVVFGFSVVTTGVPNFVYRIMRYAGTEEVDICYEEEFHSESVK